MSTPDVPLLTQLLRGVFSLVRSFIRRTICLLIDMNDDKVNITKNHKSSEHSYCTLVEPWLPRDEKGARFSVDKPFDDWISDPVGLLTLRLARYYYEDPYLATAAMCVFYEFIQMQAGCKVTQYELQYIAVASYSIAIKQLYDDYPSVAELASLTGLDWRQLRFFEAHIFFKMGCRRMHWEDIQPHVACMEFLLGKPQFSQNFPPGAPPDFIPTPPAPRYRTRSCSKSKAFDRNKYLRDARASRLGSKSGTPLRRSSPPPFPTRLGRSRSFHVV